MWDLNYKHLHILFTMQVALFRIVWPFSPFCFSRRFSLRFKIMKTSLSPQFNGVRLRLENYFCSEPFEGSEPCVSLVGGMTQLTAALMR